jgi:hypothetical protein
LEADFHREYGIEDLMGELGRRTWRWFIARLGSLSPESAFSHALYPVDPKTGERSRRAQVVVLEDPAEVDRFFARQGAS